MKKILLLLNGLFFSLISYSQNGSIKVNTFNTPLITLSSQSNVYSWNFKGTGFTPDIINDVLTLTNNLGNEAGTSTCTQKVNPTSSWWLNFTYTASGNQAADGIAVVFQNISGTTVLGATGGGLGVTGITPSVEFEMNLYTNYTRGVALEYNGANGMAGGIYQATGLLNIASGDPIDVLMKYNGITKTLTVIMTDNIAITTWTGTYLLDFTLAPHNIGSSAWLTFTGGTGGSLAIQTITKVYFRGAKG